MLRGRETPKAEREKIIMKHQAYNTFSGEILATTNGNHLKRRVEQLNRYEGNNQIEKAIARKYAKSWRFSHNGGFVR
jgi:hypothetical protein